MSQVKQKEGIGSTPLLDQRKATAINATIKTATMSASSRRMAKISRNTVIGKIKAQFIKDNNRTARNCRTSAATLSRKGQRGADLPYLDLPDPQTFSHLDENSLELYSLMRAWYNPIQELKFSEPIENQNKREKTMTWEQIVIVYPELFPDERPAKSRTLSTRRSSYFHILSQLIEFEEEGAAVAEAIENPEFVYPDDDNDDEDDDEAQDCF